MSETMDNKSELPDDLAAAVERFRSAQADAASALEDIVAIATQSDRSNALLAERLETIRAALATDGESSHVPASVAVEIPAPRPKSSTMQEIVPVVRDILAAASGPVRTSRLVALLQEKGLVVGGKRPDSNLSARLGQVGGFKSMGRAGWVLGESAEADDSSAPQVAAKPDLVGEEDDQGMLPSLPVARHDGSPFH